MDILMWWNVEEEQQKRLWWSDWWPSKVYGRTESKHTEIGTTVAKKKMKNTKNWMTSIVGSIEAFVFSVDDKV